MARISRRPATLPALSPRSRAAHKASVGRVLVIGGSPGMAGAPALAARGALRAGAGLVTIAVPASVRDVVAGFLAEAMTAALPCDGAGALAPAAADVLERLVARVDAVVLGPGLGRAPGTADAVQRMLGATGAPLVLDADGLHAVRGRLDEVARRRGATIVTPHEGEAAALAPLEDLRADETREQRSARIAALCRGVCVLKGPGTVVSDGTRVFVNDTGGPVLATGGTGDVLAGVVAAMLAGLPATGGDAFGAACLAVHVHGAAGDALAKRRGDRGVLAHEVADALPEAIRACAGRSAPR